jgi:hypothetical protein
LTKITCNICVPREELEAYFAEIEKKYPGCRIDELEITIDGENVNCTAKLSPVRFQRIRRITGYLVGDLSRFNNAKRHEVDDRVKHTSV